MDPWSIHLPVPVALAVVALLGYLVGRRSKPADDDILLRSRRELRRAQSVATELEKIAWTVRKSLARHHASVSRFKDRVSRLSLEQQEAAWGELCKEAEEILRPTLQLASQMATAYDEIRQQSANLMTFTEVRTDPLTGMSNRRGLDDALNVQFALMARYGTEFSLAMFDIDHFKEVNDKQGHLAGDRILRDLARLCDESARETDVVVRYGGEEFVLVMPQTDLEGASLFADRLRAKVAAAMPVSISGGVTTALDGDTQDSLLARADEALYAAKSGGRNRTYRHTGQVIETVVEDTAEPNADPPSVVDAASTVPMTPNADHAAL